MINKYPAVYFVTGTDTDVGKTYVSCGILQAAQKIGLTTAAIKPIAAGGAIINGKLCNDDALALQKCSSLALSYSDVNPVCLKQAIAPHIAANNENKKISTAQLCSLSQQVIKKEADITIVEGAGGWEVPINNTENIPDLVKALHIPVVLVVAMRLGCLNHALLSVKAILSDNIMLAGWVANQTEASMPAYEENLATLTERIPAPLLTEIKYDHCFSVNSSCAEQIDIAKFLNWDN